MTTAVVLALTVGVLWAAVGVVLGHAPAGRERLGSFFALYSVIYFLFAVATVPSAPAGVADLLLLALLQIPASAAELAGFWLLRHAMNRGNQGIAWAVIQSAMVIPFLGALFLPGNHVAPAQIAGLALLFAGLGCLAREKQAGIIRGEGIDMRSFGLPLAVAFLLVGVSQFLRLLPNYLPFSDAALSWRLLLSSLAGLIWWNGYAVVRRRYPLKGVWGTALLYGLSAVLGQFVFYRAADAAASCGWSTAVIPAAVGCSIILFSLYCAFFRRERLSASGWIGVLLITAGISGLSCAS